MDLEAPCRLIRRIVSKSPRKVSPVPLRKSMPPLGPVIGKSCARSGRSPTHGSELRIGTWTGFAMPGIPPLRRSLNSSALVTLRPLPLLRSERLILRISNIERAESSSPQIHSELRSSYACLARLDYRAVAHPPKRRNVQTTREIADRTEGRTRQAIEFEDRTMTQTFAAVDE